jgi:hypothetical protein
MAQANHALNLIRTLGARPSVPPSTPRDRVRQSTAVLAHQALPELIAALAALTMPRIRSGAASPAEIAARSEHLTDVLAVVSRYVTTVIDDTNERVALGTIDCRYIQNFFDDAASEVAGLFSVCAQRTAANQEYNGGSLS